METVMDGTENKHSNKNGFKLIIAAVSMLVIFSTPYLNITSISINMSLMQSAIYSLLLLGFWIAATKILRPAKQREEDHILYAPTQKSISRKQPLVT